MALVLAMIIAGCGGGVLSGGDGSPRTPATATTNQSTMLPPPGISSLRVLNPSALGRAHARAIENTSYVVVSNRTATTPNGTLRSRLTTRVAVDGRGRFIAAAETAGPEAPVFIGEPPSHAVYWSNGTVYLRRLSRDGRTVYTQHAPPDTWVGTRRYWAEAVPFGARHNRPATFYAAVFDAVPTRVDGQTTMEGTPVLRLEGGLEGAASEGNLPDDVESVRNVTLVALVDRDGMVRSLDLRYAGTLTGEPVRVHWSIRYSRVGSPTVDRPRWYDRAVNASGQSGDGNGSATRTADQSP